jgi:hypothetical protein
MQQFDVGGDDGTVDPYKMLFPVRLTAVLSPTSSSSSSAGSIPSEFYDNYLYSFVEQIVDPDTGQYEDADSPREGDAGTGGNNALAVEINNRLVSVPCYAQLRLRGIVNGQPYYEFNAGIPGGSSPSSSSSAASSAASSATSGTSSSGGTGNGVCVVTDTGCSSSGLAVTKKLLRAFTQDGDELELTLEESAACGNNPSSSSSSSSAGGGGGTVTSVSSGNLSPLFTTSVANPTTTPAISYSLSTQSANRVFAGPTSGGAAAPTFRALVVSDIPSLDGLTAGDPALADEVPVYSAAASGNRKVTLSELGGLLGISMFGGRISSDSTDPFENVDNFGTSSVRTTIEIAPFTSDRIILWDGTRFVSASFLSTPSLSTSGHTANTTYYVYCYLNSGTPTLETSTTVPALIDGVPYKTSDRTRLYLGAVRIDSTGNSYIWRCGNRNIANYWNRIGYADIAHDSTSSWTSNGNTVWSAINGGNIAWKHTFMAAWANWPVCGQTMCHADLGYSHALALTGTTFSTANSTAASAAAGVAFDTSTTAQARFVATLGTQYVQGIQTSFNAVARTCYGTGSTVIARSGMRTQGVW